MRVIFLPLLALAACEPASPPDAGAAPEADVSVTELTAPVIAAERAFAARHQEVNARRAWQDFAAPDGVDIGPEGVRPLPEAVLDWPEDGEPAFIQWGPALAGTARSGELGFTLGPAIFGAGRAYATYLTVWHEQPDGDWKWLIDLGSPLTDDDLGPIPAEPDILPFALSTPTHGSWAALAEADSSIDQDTLPIAALPTAWLMGFTARPAEGEDAWASELDARPDRYSSDHQGGGISEAGDLGWTYGFLDHSTEDGSTARGGYLRIWQHGPDGWRIAVDNSRAFPQP